mmetsp:Transcript_87172/g.174408  ORF Transcript_87172/g.174408 Transcript_87172/m.174408 type:complete len:337 (+) Transcript_87172:727-1737(+)
MNVTYYAAEIAPCVSPLFQQSEFSNTDTQEQKISGTSFIRTTCTKYYTRLVFEWARYEMALGWIKGCPECKGWMLVCDVKDTVFQRPPFEDLQRNVTAPDAVGEVKPDLLLFEEAYPPPLGLDNSDWFAWTSIRNCYGAKLENEMMAEYRRKPMLCSGSTMGTRKGLSRYLSAITRRFYEMMWLGPGCKPPMVVDQVIHNWLFYTSHGYPTANVKGSSFEFSFGGKTGDMAVAMPFGTGPVQTVGHLCWAGEVADLTLGQVSEVNLSIHLPNGFFLNNDGRAAPVVHQHDRCHKIWKTPLRDLCLRSHQALRLVIHDERAIRPDSQVCTGYFTGGS